MTFFSFKYQATQKIFSGNSQKVASASSTEGICVQTLFSGKSNNFSGNFDTKQPFWPFFVIFRVKNSIFTIFWLKTGNINRYQRILLTLGILKRYHTSPNSQYFSFQRRKRSRKSTPEIFLKGLDEKIFLGVFI